MKYRVKKCNWNERGDQIWESLGVMTIEQFKQIKLVYDDFIFGYSLDWNTIIDRFMINGHDGSKVEIDDVSYDYCTPYFTCDARRRRKKRENAKV